MIWIFLEIKNQSVSEAIFNCSIKNKFNVSGIIKLGGDNWKRKIGRIVLGERKA
jgi:hypothetical protein